ncbi:MAG: glycosyl transferase [Clostridia bacterium]|nr:glycosyl transferase [Clostridia bacterium]
MSDERFLKRKYRLVMGKPLNLKNPKTYNEKLQWLKLYDRKPEYTTMVDKYEVKQYVSSLIGEDYIIPTLGVWDKFEEIGFDALPEQFVLKCTHDSGGLAICRDKAKFDIDKAKKKIELCFKRNYFWSNREWPYKNVKPRIIAERYMEDENEAEGLTDYKFFCFNGEPKLLYVSQGLQNHATAAISFYDLEGNEMPFHRSDYKPIAEKMILPERFDEMLSIVRKLAAEVNNPFVRIDLYSICGKIYFSEITFFPCSGMLPFEPEEWDYTFGSWINLPDKTEL